MNGSERLGVVIVGAGPYGLAGAAHLRAAGVETVVFGRTMEFWRRSMPAGMFLRSAWEASHIADPRHELRLDDYQAERGRTIPTPIPLADFVAYGEWFQQRAVPDVDARNVQSVDRSNGHFRLELDDGDRLDAQRVVLATGLERFPRRPATFAQLPEALCSHALEHTDLGRFAGQRVLVVGGGQSALESAALLAEAGAEVEVLIRSDRIHWLVKGRLASRLGPAKRILYPPTDVGPPGLNWLIALPDLFRSLPQDFQVRSAKRAIRPAGAEWLRERLRAVPLTIGRSVLQAQPNGDGLRLRLDDGTERQVDHVLLATGYQIQAGGYSILAPRLLSSLATIRGYPRLGAGLESSSVPGLHFVGAAAAESFGPLMRFVAGTGYTARALTRRVLGGALARRTPEPLAHPPIGEPRASAQRS